ncbi:hypothetical protein M434DRAFT_9036 [Hypoxylon sp. CO27-5]|nr:hypothetical protein M434DRAFT_9036 [Hypoxylon sp. CO27-5]
MPLNTRPLIRASRVGLLARQTQTPRLFYSSGSQLPGGTSGESSEQATPLGPYYEAILNRPQPIPEVKPEDPPTSSPKSPRSTVKKTPVKKPKEGAENVTSSSSPSPSSSSGPVTSTEPASAKEKARIIFGSRLAGPAERAERLEAIRKRSTLIAGVLVPPRPEEPDNCCMSGCVNCVWDRYRDEMEEWIAASTRAQQALEAQRAHKAPPPEKFPGAVKGTEHGAPGPDGAISMDDDGGGSETNWQTDFKIADRPKIAKDLWDDEIYKNVPVGIREFMKQEKRLKEKHMREGTFGA